MIWVTLPFPKEQVAAFNKVYPNVKITQRVTPYLPTSSSGAATLISGVGAPDGIFFLEDAYLGQYADALYDVTPYVQPFAKEIAPYKLAVAHQGGRIVSIPEDVDPCFLIYRKDIVAKAGVDVSAIHTYDDLIAAARKVKAAVPSCTTPLFFNGDQNTLVFMLEGLAWQQGSGMADASGKLRLDNAAYTRAFQYLEKAAKAGVVSTGLFATPSLYGLWNQGQACFVHFANWWNYWNAPGLKSLWGKFSIAKQPVFRPGDSPYSMIGGAGFVVPARGKRPDLGALFGSFVLLDRRGFGAAKDFSNYEFVLPAAAPLWDVVKPLQQARHPYPILDPATPVHEMLTVAAKGAPSSYRYPAWYARTFPYLGPKVEAVLKGKMSATDAQAAAYQDVQAKVVARYR